jgi:hypothetical protein
MLGTLEQYGWERDTLSDIFIQGNEIILTFSHESFPSCDLTMFVDLAYSLVDGGDASVCLVLRTIDLDEEDTKEWCNEDVVIEDITECARQIQEKIDA